MAYWTIAAIQIGFTVIFGKQEILNESRSVLIDGSLRICYNTYR